MSELAVENNVPVVAEDVVAVAENEVRPRKKPSSKRSNALEVMAAEAELLTKGINVGEDIDGKRTTRSSTRVSTVASKLKKSEPPSKKLKKTPTVKGGKRGRPKVAAKDESNEEDVISAEENGLSDGHVDTKIDQGGSSTEDEVDTKLEENLENGNSSIDEEEKDVGEDKESADEEKSVVTEKKDQ